MEGEPEVMLCAVCGRVLDYHSANGYFHTRLDRDQGADDHPAVPVAQSGSFEGILRCDFCLTDYPTHVVPARTFMVTPGNVSRGNWAACDICADLIFYGRWRKLIERAIAHSRTGLPSDVMEKTLRVLYNALRKNLTGPPRKL